MSRVPLPNISLDAANLNALLASGPILRFEHLPLDWSDIRFLLRATASAMRTHDAIDDQDCRRVEALSRDSERLPAAMRRWYESVRAGAPALEAEAGLETVFQQSMRPFLTRAADAITREDGAVWRAPAGVAAAAS